MEAQVSHMFLTTVTLTTRLQIRMISLNPLDSLTPVSVSFFFIDNLTIPRAESDNSETLSGSQATTPWKENEKFIPLCGIQISGCLKWGRQHVWIMCSVPGPWVTGEVGRKRRTRATEIWGETRGGGTGERVRAKPHRKFPGCANQGHMPGLQ